MVHVHLDLYFSDELVDHFICLFLRLRLYLTFIYNLHRRNKSRFDMPGKVDGTKLSIAKEAKKFEIGGFDFLFVLGRRIQS